jgi:uncharacterized membrane protein (UPF0136 family)
MVLCQSSHIYVRVRLMNPGIIAAIAYGLLSMVGGIVGYTKAKSQASLISGLISGILLILGGILTYQGMSWGLISAAIVTGVLIVVFASRLNKTRKFMPAGLMLIAGVIAMIVILLSFMAG